MRSQRGRLRAGSQGARQKNEPAAEDRPLSMEAVMKRPVFSGSLALLLLLPAVSGTALAQRGYYNPYPQYPQSPPGGGYLTDSRSAPHPETLPTPQCLRSRATGC
jgi:hypothetical protein